MGSSTPVHRHTALTHVPLEVGELSLGVPRAMEPNHLHFIYLFFRLIEKRYVFEVAQDHITLRSDARNMTQGEKPIWEHFYSPRSSAQASPSRLQSVAFQESFLFWSVDMWSVNLSQSLH